MRSRLDSRVGFGLQSLGFMESSDRPGTCPLPWLPSRDSKETEDQSHL